MKPGIIFILCLLILSKCSDVDYFTQLDNIEAKYISVSYIYPADIFSLDYIEETGNDFIVEIEFEENLFEDSLRLNSAFVIKLGLFSDETVQDDYNSILQARELAQSTLNYSALWDIIDAYVDDTFTSGLYEIVQGAWELDASNALKFKSNNFYEANTLYLIILHSMLSWDFSPVIPLISGFLIQSEPSVQGANPSQGASEETRDPGEGENVQAIEGSGEVVYESLYDSPQALDLVINEFLADPASDITGDANIDGERSSYDDEFVEIVNVSGKTLDLINVSLAVSSISSIKHTFSEFILEAGACVVIFGGGNVPESMGSCNVFASDNSLRLSNSGSSIYLVLDDNIIDSVEYGSEAGNDQSLSRNPDLTGDFTLHTEIQEAQGLLFSPGTQVNGSVF
ncbi:MAG: lamin tail domain-containing protein [Pseudomonadota bacterium]